MENEKNKLIEKLWKICLKRTYERCVNRVLCNKFDEEELNFVLMYENFRNKFSYKIRKEKKEILENENVELNKLEVRAYSPYEKTSVFYYNVLVLELFIIYPELTDIEKVKLNKEKEKMIKKVKKLLLKRVQKLVEEYNITNINELLTWKCTD